jgi:ubiquinone/menaquinone biosynthesis C-methylase UbiE
VVDASPLDRRTSFGRRAEDYDRVRPEYPPEAIDLAMSRLGIGPESDVLDLAAGTGKLTRPLVERFRRVIAVEPDPGMRAVLNRATEAFRVLDGTAEAIPLDDGSVDAVFVGQAFHWFDTRVALAEIGRVLRPRGGLVLIWNAWSDAEPPVSPEADEVIRGVLERSDLEPISMESDEWEWHTKFEDTDFEELREEKVEVGPILVDAERLVTLQLSTSPFGTLSPDEFDAVERRLRRLVVGDYRLPLHVELHWTRLR